MKRSPAISRSSASLTYDEIAARLGISHTSVQNIEKRALEKMRREAERLGWGGEP